LRKYIQSEIDRKPLVAIEDIEAKILNLRGQKVMLDADLAELYGVETKVLNQAVKRNADRFPEDFMFQLTPAEHGSLRSQIVTLKIGRGQHRKFMPYAFTEHGALMLGNVLKSARAVEASLLVVRVFVRLRELVSTHKDLSAKFDELERKVSGHDQAIAGLIHAIRELMKMPDPKRKRPIGFAQWKE
jgi:hypothetical protein